MARRLNLLIILIIQVRFILHAHQKHQASSFDIIIMFSKSRQKYPKACQIRNELSRKEMQDFLAFAPWSEFQKLNLLQVNLLKDNVCFMSSRGTRTRDWNCAFRDLFLRENQILSDRKKREQGVLSTAKKQESLFTIISQKICNIFKSSTSDKDHKINESKERLCDFEKPLLKYNQRQYKFQQSNKAVKDK